MANWKSVFSTSFPYQAEIVKDVLEDRGLKPIVLNKKEYFSQTGFCEVLVEQDELIMAIKIIQDEIQFK